MSFEVMLLIVLGPIIISVITFIYGLKKKNKILVVVSSIILLIFSIRAILTFIVLANWNHDF